MKRKFKPALKQTARQIVDPCAGRLSNLAMELTLAGGQVLREDFGFDEQQVNLWLDKMLARARTNRDAQSKSS